MSIAPIGPIEPAPVRAIGRDFSAERAVPSPPVSFTRMLLDGAEAASAKVAGADRLVQAAVLDTSVPLHRVTYALEEARISLELMIQLRNRLVDAAQQIMNMQV